MASDSFADMQGKTVCLVDGSGYIFRAYYSLPAMTRSDGTPTNAVYGFCLMLSRLLKDKPADRWAVLFDTARTTFRNTIYPAYKANRSDPPEDLVPQFALMREAVQAHGVASIELEGFEADDLIASLAHAAVAQGAKVTIVSSDKDLMQLVSPQIRMWDPMKNRWIDAQQVQEKFGVTPERVIDVQALAGDSSDNVPGVEGIGPKTAAELIQKYGDLESVLARASEIPQPRRRQRLMEQAEQALISRKLVTLRSDVPVELQRVTPPSLDPAALSDFFKAMEFSSLLKSLPPRNTPGSGGTQKEQDTQRQPETPAAGAAVTPDYALVQTPEALQAWCQRIMHEGVMAFDLETTSLTPHKAEVVGIALAVKPGQACYIPIGHRLVLLEEQLLPEQVWPALTSLLTEPSVLKVMHNAKYDLGVLLNLGITVTALDDTLLMSFVLDAGRHGHGMDELARLYLEFNPISFEEVCGKGKDQKNFADVSLEAACAYAAEDADVTVRLHKLFRQRLVQENMLTVYETIERPLPPVIAAMEHRGIQVNPDLLRTLSADFGQRLTQLEGEIRVLAEDESLNPGSPRQLGEVLFGKLGLPGAKKTRTGQFVTDQATLEPLQGQHEIVEKVLQWRHTAKLKSTYTDALLEHRDPDNDRVHTHFSMTGAQTGRLSSTEPNLQNIPIRTPEGRAIREAFIAAPGCMLVALDYSQIELRLLAEIADIESLRAAFARGEDIHKATAAQVFAVAPEAVDSTMRRHAKSINFGVIYGISAHGLALQIGASRTEAQRFIDQYLERYPGIAAYMERARAQMREQGFVRTLFGRKIHIRGGQNKNPVARRYAERQAINAPIQGSAADVIKRAMWRIHQSLCARGLEREFRVLLQVHDELVVEVPEGRVDEAVDLMRCEMEGAAAPLMDLRVALTVDCESGRTWGL